MERQNRIYWLTKLSGAGKTTIGRLWRDELRHAGDTVISLDGAEIRSVFGAELGFNTAYRQKLAKNYGRLCALLTSQGERS